MDIGRNTVTLDPGTTGAEPDARLLERFAAGRQEAFALLVDRYGGLVFHACRRILRHHQDAEEAYQATFVVLARQAQAIRRPDALGSWLYAVATRVALRQRARLRRLHAVEQATPVPEPPAPCADPAAAACQSDEAGLLTEELGRLPDKYRDPLVLCYLEGETTAAAAARLRVPVGTFKSRLAKARDLLRARLRVRGVALTAAVLSALRAEGAAPTTVPPALSGTACGPAAARAVPDVGPTPGSTRGLRRPGWLAGALAASLVAGALLIALRAGRPVPAALVPPPEGVGPGRGTLVVANQRGNTVVLLDVRTGKVRATVRTDPGPHEVAVSPQGRTAAVANYGVPIASGYGHTVTLLDVATGQVIQTIALRRRAAPHGLQWLTEDRLLCACETPSALLELDTTRRTVARTLKTGQVGSRMLAVSADRRWAYAANFGSNTVTAFDFARGTKFRDVDVGKAPVCLALSPNDRWLWVGNRDDQTISAIDARDFRVVRTLPALGVPFRITFTPDGRSALVSRPAACELAVYETATLREVRRIPFDRGKVPLTGTSGRKPGPTSVACSPDSRLAYCTVLAGDAVAVVDLERGEVVGKLPAGDGPDGIAFSPVSGTDP